MTSDELAARAESAGEGEQAEVLRDAWELIHFEGYGDPGDGCQLCDAFQAKIGAEAYLDAALMLLPEGAFLYISGPWNPIDVSISSSDFWCAQVNMYDRKDDPRGRASTAALALIAAILRSDAATPPRVSKP